MVSMAVHANFQAEDIIRGIMHTISCFENFVVSIWPKMFWKFI